MLGCEDRNRKTRRRRRWRGVRLWLWSGGGSKSGQKRRRRRRTRRTQVYSTSAAHCWPRPFLIACRPDLSEVPGSRLIEEITSRNCCRTTEKVLARAPKGPVRLRSGRDEEQKEGARVSFFLLNNCATQTRADVAFSLETQQKRLSVCNIAAFTPSQLNNTNIN